MNNNIAIFEYLFSVESLWNTKFLKLLASLVEGTAFLFQ
jgi:hypothetical protein